MTDQHPVTGQFVSARNMLAAGHYTADGIAGTAANYDHGLIAGPPAAVADLHQQPDPPALGGMPPGHSVTLTGHVPHAAAGHQGQPQVTVQMLDLRGPANAGLSFDHPVNPDPSPAAGPEVIAASSRLPALPRAMAGFNAYYLGGQQQAPGVSMTGRAPGE